MLLGLGLGVVAFRCLYCELFHLVSFSSCIPSLLHTLLLFSFSFSHFLSPLHKLDWVPGCYKHMGRCIFSMPSQQGLPWKPNPSVQTWSQGPTVLSSQGPSKAPPVFSLQGIWMSQTLFRQAGKAQNMTLLYYSDHTSYSMFPLKSYTPLEEQKPFIHHHKK